MDSARRPLPRWLPGLLVAGVAAAWVCAFLGRGWIPHDDGILALNAQRVRHGMLPARDFVDIYTGGLSFLFAGTQALLGDNLLVLRVPLVLLFTAFVAALFGVARRLLPPAAAAAVVLVGVGWSLPNYTTPMPSWFNLCFGGLGMWALSRFLDSRRRGWLALAGAFGAASLLVKVIGLYFVGAGLLFLLYVEGDDARAEAPSASRSRAGSLVPTAAVAVFALGLVSLVGRRLTLPDAVHFLLPGLSLGGLVLWREWSRPNSSGLWQRVRSLSALVAPFLAGFALPLALYLIPYAATGSLHALYDGVFVLPQQRLQTVAQPPRELGHLVCPLALAALLATLPRARSGAQRAAIWAVLAALAGAAVWAGWNRFAYTFFWDSLVQAPPVVVVLGALHLARRAPAQPAPRDARLALILIMTGLLSLVEFPLAGPVYFLFVAPLLILAIAALASTRELPAGPSAALLALYAAFAIAWLNQGFVFQLGKQYQPSTQTQVLPLERAGGIRVKPLDFEQYPALVAALAGAAGEFVYAGPNCPEVHYLAGVRDPFEAPGSSIDPNADPERFLAFLDARRVRFVIFNGSASFSEAPSQALLRAAALRYPQSRVVGKFLLRWR